MLRRSNSSSHLGLAFSLVFLPLPLPLPLLAAGAQESQVLRDVRALADDRLEGRKIGTPGADSAAAFIARRFEAIGLRPAPALEGWLQTFQVTPPGQGADPNPVRGSNVIGVLRGHDPRWADHYVVIGAHYDHLGRGGSGSLEPDSIGVVHNGADDNASGVAALLEIARRLAENPPARSVIFIAFGGEEQGLLGSTVYTRQPVVPLDRVTMMLNLDMVGRLRDGRLTVNGVESAAEWPALLDSLNLGHGLALHPQPGAYGPSDHTSFTIAGVPVLHFFTGTHEDYHRPTDDWVRINAPGIERIAAFADDLVTRVGNREASLQFVQAPPPAPATRGSGYGAYLGSIPDMTESPGGVRLSGVRPGSPAAEAGLQSGDIIIRIGEHVVSDLQTMTDALRAHQPGDQVELRYLRDGAEHQVRVTLGRRGS